MNLCYDRDYLDIGYYCSLLAEARGHRILPGVRTINDLAERENYVVDVEELNRSLVKLLSRRQNQINTTRLEFTLVFGKAPVNEDMVLGHNLYQRIMQEFAKRLEKRGC